jgi:hypothetical protein
MNIFACFQHLIPEVHAFSDEEQRYNFGATWTAGDGLKDYHNLELRYVHNSERLALQGDPQPDGSWIYKEPSGTVHRISAERAAHFMEQTHQHATLMCQMLDRLNALNMPGKTIDTHGEAA